MAIQNTTLTTAAASIYTSTGNNVTSTIHLCNFTNAAVTANLFAVPSGGTAGNATIIYSNVSITAYNTLIVNQEKFLLNNGDAIFANCSANNAIATTVSFIGI
jgi:hypothetical protein